MKIIAALFLGLTPADPGQVLFTDNCAACHGDDGRGVDSEPDIRGKSPAQLRRAFGGMDAMPEFDFTDDEIAALAEYLHVLKTR